MILHPWVAYLKKIKTINIKGSVMTLFLSLHYFYLFACEIYPKYKISFAGIDYASI
jgi:hypothetical protein